MRRIVHDYVRAALARSKQSMEQYIAQNLECPEAFPFAFSDSLAAAINEIRHVRVKPRFRSDYPAVDVIVSMRVALTGRTRRRDEDLGVRRLLLDVAFSAIGTVQASGYEIAPRHAHLVAWWGTGNDR